MHFARQQAENYAYKSVRIAIEWNYGHTSNLFSYLLNLDKLKLMDGDICARIFTVCVLLRNAHVALYGCQFFLYFDIPIYPRNVGKLEKMMRCEN